MEILFLVAVNTTFLVNLKEGVDAMEDMQSRILDQLEKLAQTGLPSQLSLQMYTY